MSCISVRDHFRFVFCLARRPNRKSPIAPSVPRDRNSITSALCGAPRARSREFFDLFLVNFFFFPEVRKTSVCSWYRYETGIRWSTMCRPIIGVGRDSARRSDSSRAERRTIGESAQPGGTLRSRETHETRRSRTQYLSKRGSGTSRGARA